MGEKMEKTEIREKLNKGWLQVALIIELLGKPKDYLEKVIDAAIDHLGEEKGVVLLKKTVHPANLAEGAQDAFTTFGEAEILTEDMAKLIGIIFDYMPSSVEIVEPSTLNLKLEDANALLNDLATRMHHYDALAKKMRLEHELLAKKLEMLQGKINESESN